MSVDEQLLAAQNAKDQPNQESSSSERAGALREQQGGAGNQEGETGDLRSQVMASRKNRAVEAAKKKKEERKSISFRYSQILKENIFNLVTSFGTSYFYIVYHWFQSKLGNKRKYVKLGSEWMDNPAITEKQRDEIGSNFAPWENCCFVSAAFGCLVSVLLATLPLVLIGYFIAHPLQAAWENLSLVWNIIKSIFSS
ncbi:MAG: hypothetical protein PHG95_04130 [Patescibacteria group bacterium]|nr:hypothetical protein [Patescibacteria group bacterium]